MFLSVTVILTSLLLKIIGSPPFKVSFHFQQSSKVPGCIACLIQSRKNETRVQTPGARGSPHPIPQLTIPTSVAGPSFIITGPKSRDRI